MKEVCTAFWNLAFAAALGATHGLGAESSSLGVPARLSDATAMLEQGRRAFNAASLTTAAADFESCASDAASEFDCSCGAARAYLYLTYVRELAGDRSAARMSLDPATRYAQAAVKLNPSSGPAHGLLADIYGRRILLGNAFTAMHYGPLNDKETAVAIKLAPEDPEVLAALGRRYLFAPSLFGGDPGKAAACFSRALRSGDSDLTLYFLALAQEKLGQDQEAHASLLHALSVNPGNLLVQRALAVKH